MFDRPIVRIDAKVTWHVRRGERYWVGACETLGLTAQGETWGDTMRAIDEIMTDFLTELSADNRLDQFLKSKGWKVVSGGASEPDAIPAIDLPWVVEETGARA